MNTKSKMSRPASWWNDLWREGTPLGNGLHGALLYGNTANERVMLTHTRLWRHGQTPPMPDVSDVLPEMRRLIREKRMPEADRMLVDALKNRGYSPANAFPTPAADINLDLPNLGVFKNYSRELDMETAQGFVSYDRGGEMVNRRAFVSRGDDVVVIECHRDTIVSVNMYKPDSDRTKSDFLPKDPITKTSGEFIFFACKVDGKEHGVVARVVRGKTTLILARVFYSGSHEEEWQKLASSLSSLPADYETLLTRHIPEHQRLFDSCRFSLNEPSNLTNEQLLDIASEDELPNALTERMYDFGRYLFISATAKGGLPCNLTGLWSGDYQAFWAFNMSNINLEMTYWHAAPGSLTELIMPFFDYFDNSLEDFRDNAQKLFGCRGIYIPAVTMPGVARHCCLLPHVTNWTAGAGWIAQHYYDFWLYTGDRKFLEERAIPFMKEAAKFYADFVEWDADGWHVCPSISPENRTLDYCRVHEKTGKPPINIPDHMQTSIDAAMDIAVIRELFSNLHKLSEVSSSISEDERQFCQKMLDNSPKYQINAQNSPCEWLNDDYPDNDKHRHQSHLYPMFPGLERVRESRETDEIYREGGLRRLRIGLDSQTSWSLIQCANLMARVRDAETAFECLNIISKTCIIRNLFTLHNDWRSSGITWQLPQAPFQIDAVIGWASAVQEMLLFSMPGRIDVLPACPKKWRSGRIGTLQTRCGVAVRLDWTPDSVNVELIANRDTEFDLHLPTETLGLKMKRGESKILTGKR